MKGARDFLALFKEKQRENNFIHLEVKSSIKILNEHQILRTKEGFLLHSTLLFTLKYF